MQFIRSKMCVVITVVVIAAGAAVAVALVAVVPVLVVVVVGIVAVLDVVITIRNSSPSSGPWPHDKIQRPSSTSLRPPRVPRRRLRIPHTLIVVGGPCFACVRFVSLTWNMNRMSSHLCRSLP